MGQYANFSSRSLSLPIEISDELAPANPVLAAYNAANIPAGQEFKDEFQQKQQAILEQQRHELQLQQQKEYYQAKLQVSRDMMAIILTRFSQYIDCVGKRRAA